MKTLIMVSLTFLILAAFNMVFGQEDKQEQTNNNDQQKETIPIVKPVHLAGPRVGITFLSKSFTDKIKEKHDIELQPTLIQFGWQFEKRFFTVRSGVSALNEWIILVGGFEQEKFIPSITWLIGIRSAEGFEFGVGPNLALSGTSVVLAAGVTLHSNEINFPINFAYSSSRTGSRFSLLFGFNVREY